MLLVILLLASFLRLYGLGSNPPSLYWEEAALGYDAYSIWKTGKDYHGNPWPLVAFESFGDYKPSGYFYVLSPFVGLFGLHEWVVRLPSALAGIASVYLIYRIVYLLSNKHRIALFSALTLCLMPWHLFISRVAFEVNLGLFWLMLSVFFVLKSKKNNAYVAAAVLPLILSMYTYHGLRVIAPLFVITTGIFFLSIKKLVRTKTLYLAVLLFLAMLLPILVKLNEPAVIQRFNEVNYFSISPAVSITNALREQYNNSWWSRIIFHRYWFWGGELIGNGLSHFTSQFLFFSGDGNARHQNPHFGLLYWWMAPLLVISLFWLKWEKNKKMWWYGFAIIIISLIPASLSFPTPHALRTLPAVFGWSILIGLGAEIIYILIEKRPRIKLLITLMGVVAIFGTGLIYWQDLFSTYITNYSNSWQYGYKEAIEYINQKRSADDVIFLTRYHGRPSIYVLFYSQIDPFLAQSESKRVKLDQSEFLQFMKWDFDFDSSKKYDIIADHKKHNDMEYILEKIIYNVIGDPVFYVYRRGAPSR